jgi:hypothetical protein
MRWLLAGIAIAFLVIRTAGGVGTDPAEGGIRKGLVGTWNSVLKNRPERFKDVMHIKHITPTHWTWVTYDAKEMKVMATAGGTWTLAADNYKEKCEFSGTGYEHLRGKEFAYILKFDGDELLIKSARGTAIEVDEVWRRMKPGD